jgi:hypothetical protein
MTEPPFPIIRPTVSSGTTNACCNRAKTRHRINATDPHRAKHAPLFVGGQRTWPGGGTVRIARTHRARKVKGIHTGGTQGTRGHLEVGVMGEGSGSGRERRGRQREAQRDGVGMRQCGK